MKSPPPSVCAKANAAVFSGEIWINLCLTIFCITEFVRVYLCWYRRKIPSPLYPCSVVSPALPTIQNCSGSLWDVPPENISGIVQELKIGQQKRSKWEVPFTSFYDPRYLFRFIHRKSHPEISTFSNSSVFPVSRFVYSAFTGIQMVFP